MRFPNLASVLAVLVVCLLSGCGSGSESPASISAASSAASPSSSGTDTTDSSAGASSSSSSSSTGVAASSSSSSSSPPAANGTATLSWTTPTTNSNGSALLNLAGYHIYYGTNPSALSNEVDVQSASAVSYQITNLASGTWYFSLTSYTTSGVESGMSPVVSKTIS